MAVAAVVVVAVGLGLGLRPDGLLAGPGASPTPGSLVPPTVGPSSSPGVPSVDQPAEYRVSFDATHWTKQALTGDAATAESPTGGVRPFLLRDGVLFSGDE